ncbi:hypothetical protein PISL3812_09191 [Talaromyces islandicus]|uniref:O-methyltransferase domain-containing protein n=1 Tax=Talaromyces islandicus TaxID=28573 RepID=A0A0U1M996_TALIS|nr:hypothetical protein PISL3812_09191 [Talaromyces islandicus]
MDNLNQLQIYCTELASALTSFLGHYQNSNFQQCTIAQPASDSEEVQRAREKILSLLTKIKTLIWSPTDFLQHLASQNEILACLHWLGENQILACIPSAGSVPIKDIADLSGVSATQLSRTIRLSATAGFLVEPQAGHVAHTQLSATFISNPSLLDAAEFLSEFVAPVTLQMPQHVTTQQRPGHSQQQPSADDSVPPSVESFQAARERRPKINRQWPAYLHHVGGLYAAKDVAAILTQLNWAKITNVPDACIIEVNVQPLSNSISQSLAQIYPLLHFNVQVLDNEPGTTSAPELEDLNPRLTVTSRTLGKRQRVSDAVVYILHLPSASTSIVLDELTAHVDALRTRGSIMLILTARVLPEPGSLSDPEAEAKARSRDLALLQLTNEGEMEMDDLLEIIGTVGDNTGRLVVTKKLCARNGLVVALVVKYQAGQPIREI